MEYDTSSIKMVLKKVAIIVLIAALICTSIILALLFVTEKDRAAALKDDKEALEIRVDAAEDKIEEQKIELDALKNNNEYGNSDSKAEILSTEALLNKELTELKNGNEDVIRRWFGSGIEYTSENVSRFTQYAKVTATESKDTPDGYISIHVCNMDNRKLMKLNKKLTEGYNKKNVAMKESDRDALVNEKVQAEIRNGGMDKHFSLIVRSDNGVLEITDELKQALTGGWYHGSIGEMQGYKCIFE